MGKKRRKGKRILQFTWITWITRIVPEEDGVRSCGV